MLKESVVDFVEGSVVEVVEGSVVEVYCDRAITI